MGGYIYQDSHFCANLLNLRNLRDLFDFQKLKANGQKPENVIMTSS